MLSRAQTFANWSQSTSQLEAYYVNDDEAGLQSEEKPLVFAVLYFLDVSLYPQTLEGRGKADENIAIFREVGRAQGCSSFASKWGPSGPAVSSNTACPSALH